MSDQQAGALVVFLLVLLAVSVFSASVHLAGRGLERAAHGRASTAYDREVERQRLGAPRG